MKIKRGSTSVRRLVFIGDSTSTTNAGLVNLAHNTAGLVAYYYAGDLADEVQIALASATLGTFTSGGFVAVDNTTMPGWYEIGIPNAALDGGNEVAIQLRGAANMLPVNIYIELDAFDYQTATQPVNVTQFGGQNGTFSGGRPEVNATHWGGTAIASANVLIDGAITSDKIAASAMNGKGDWGTASSLGELITTVGEAGSGLTDVTTQVAAALASAHGAGSWATATGFSTLTASGVRDAIGMATNNLDTQLGLLATSSALAALVNTVGVAGAGLTEAGGTGDQFTAIPWNAAWDAEVQSECTDAIVAAGLPRSGVTLRYTQVAANSGSKTADVSIGAVP